MIRFRNRVLRLLISVSVLMASGVGWSDNTPHAMEIAADPSPARSATAILLPTATEPHTEQPAPSPTGPPPSAAPLAAYTGPVEHVFFHPLVVDPSLAFDGDSLAQGYDDYFVTVPEFQAIVEELYKRNYMLIDIHLLYKIETGDGRPAAARRPLMLPEGKKPLVLSVDDLNYYDYMRANGDAWRLVPDPGGGVAAEIRTPNGENARTSRTGEIVPILDDFVKRHPDFSFQGAKGILNLTGYEGVLGYRTNDKESPDYASEKQGAETVIRLLKEDGWTFASHSWGHIDVAKSSLERLKKDTARWKEEVEALVGPTAIFVYPYGSGVKPSDPRISYLKSQGFAVFFGIGPEPYLTDACGALFMDRRHIDGIALRTQRKRLEPLLGDRDLLDPARSKSPSG